MSIATYAYESDGSKCLKNGAYKVYIKNGKLILYDGTTEYIIDGGGSGDTYDPTITVKLNRISHSDSSK